MTATLTLSCTVTLMRQSLSTHSDPHDTASEPVVEVRGLVKEFGRFRALDHFDMTVRRGEVHGFLGPNGAGKSTTLRALLGALRVDSGRARVFGLDPWHDTVALHHRIAYVPGDVSLWPGLTGGQCIDALLGLRGRIDRQRRDRLVEAFRLDPTKRARTYSTGNRQKVALVAAFAADADLLILDEPTSGLDPLMEQVFQEQVRYATERGVTVLLSSHILGEVEELCERVTIIREGRTLRTGTLADLREDTSSRVSYLTRTPPAAHELPGDVRVDTQSTPDGHHVNLHVPESAVTAVVADALDRAASNLVVEPPTLDELFLHHYRGEEAGR